MWIPLALLAGLADATVYASMKMLREVPPYVVLWWRYALGIPVLVGLVALDGIPELQVGLWWVLVLNSVGIAGGSLLLIRATQIASLSSSMPMLAFTPVFLLGTSYLMLGERPGPGGTVGVVLIAVGAYLLNVHQLKLGPLAPLRALVSNRGSLYVLLTALIYAVTANLVKMGVQRSSATFFPLLSYLFITAAVLPFMLRSARGQSAKLVASWRPLVLMGTAGSLMMVFYAIAVQLTIVPYVIALKRTNGLFSVLYGKFLFKETHLRQSLLGASIMFAGVLLITLLG